jgi:hypothetical protein
MYMWVVRHGGTPGMEHRSNANLGTKVFLIRRNLDHRVRAHPQQQIVDLPFVLIRDVGNWLWQVEDEMKIANGQQLGLTCRQPGFGSGGLTFGAVPVPTGVIRDMLMGTVFAARNVTAKRRREGAPITFN